jgi:hypothetical protein
LAHHLVTVDSTNAVLILSPYRKRSRSDGVLVVADVGVQLRYLDALSYSALFRSARASAATPIW